MEYLLYPVSITNITQKSGVALAWVQTMVLSENPIDAKVLHPQF